MKYQVFCLISLPFPRKEKKTHSSPQHNKVIQHAIYYTSPNCRCSILLTKTTTKFTDNYLWDGIISTTNDLWSFPNISKISFYTLKTESLKHLQIYSLYYICMWCGTQWCLPSILGSINSVLIILSKCDSNYQLKISPGTKWLFEIGENVKFCLIEDKS